MIEIKEEMEPPRRALLVALETRRDSRWEIEDLLAELSQLAETAGLKVAGVDVSRRLRPHPATYVGTGKAEEIAGRCRADSIDTVVFNGDLSPVQLRNLQDATGVSVRDRTELILEIFARRARTREARHQIELARLQYQLPRLAGAWTHLSRQKGGMKGTRDTGEKQVEIDRRMVRVRINQLKKEIDRVRRHRESQRKMRRRSGIPLVSIIGYTNSGKSTLLNALTDASVPVENKLFATLDPTTRKATLPSGRDVLFSDTVGFIRHLPHYLIDAFRATLEEVAQADLLLEVLDISHRMVWERRNAVEAVLKELEADEKPRVVALNKTDLVGYSSPVREAMDRLEAGVPISALARSGLPKLLQVIDDHLDTARRRHNLLIPQGRGDLIARLHREGQVLRIEYRKKDVRVEVLIEDQLLGAAREYITS